MGVVVELFGISNFDIVFLGFEEGLGCGSEMLFFLYDLIDDFLWQQLVYDVIFLVGLGNGELGLVVFFEGVLSCGIVVEVFVGFL